MESCNHDILFAWSTQVFYYEGKAVIINMADASTSELEATTVPLNGEF
jgi:hypothetical protein